MQTYSAPLRDMRFVLNELLDVGTLATLPGYEDATPDVIDAMIEEGAKLCENTLLPLNRSADEEGCHYENGVVRTPAGYKEAYKTFVDAGWTGVTLSPAYGGKGLPQLISMVFDEMVCSTNLAFGVYPLLSNGAAALIENHATETLKETYLPRLADGTWSGTMCLTEPHCGTDLGLIRTKAVPTGEGRYAVSGTKIFISAGEHDLTENIVHLVLARLPDAPPGVRGISLFLVPKRTLTADGSPGPANGVSCGSIEEKMGIHGSATCVMHFEEAEGYLVGAPHKGLRCMFTMMNGARLGVGLQGLGLGETAYQSATAYAKDRRQGRGLKGAEEPEASADPIIVHPDVRRMLLTQRAINEGARALAYWAALQLDISRSHEDASVREDADELVQLMTPIIKAFFTDYGFEATNLAVQVHGGHGYIREHGMEQLVRDARISARSTRARTASRRSIWWDASCPSGPAAICGTSSTPPSPSSRPTRTTRSSPTSWAPSARRSANCRPRHSSSPSAAWAIPRRPARQPRTISRCSVWWRWATCGARWRSSPATSRTATPSTTPSSRPPASTCRRFCRTPPGSSSRSWPARAPSWPTARTSSERRVPRGA